MILPNDASACKRTIFRRVIRHLTMHKTMVSDHVASGRKSFLTDRTKIWPGTSMSNFMLYKMATIISTVGTEVTEKAMR